MLSLIHPNRIYNASIFIQLLPGSLRLFASTSFPSLLPLPVVLKKIPTHYNQHDCPSNQYKIKQQTPSTPGQVLRKMRTLSLRLALMKMLRHAVVRALMALAIKMRHVVIEPALLIRRLARPKSTCRPSPRAICRAC